MSKTGELKHFLEGMIELTLKTQHFSSVLPLREPEYPDFMERWRPR
jgi:hypothetical protein